MISGKGILITVLTATAAAALVGSMLSKEKGQSIKRFVEKLKHFSSTKTSESGTFQESDLENPGRV